VLGLVAVVAAVGLAPNVAGATATSDRGVAVYVTTTPSSIAQATATFAYVASLGANAVQLDFPFEMSSGTSNDPGPISGITPTPSLLSSMAEIAAGDGLKVQFRPLLYEGNLTPFSWRGEIKPSDPALWFATYWSFLEPYLAVAQTDGVESVYIESELDSMVTPDKSSDWNTLRDEAAGVFSGALLGTTSHTAYIERTGIAQAYDDYDPTIVPNNASVATLTASLENSLSYDAIPGSRRSLTLSEVGIAAATHAFWQPWQFTVSPPIKRSIQARWFTAMCDMTKAEHLRGIFFWDLNLSTFSPTENDSTSPTGWVGTSSATAIESCFAKLAR
jgi:hypothetical protein